MKNSLELHRTVNKMKNVIMLSIQSYILYNSMNCMSAFIRFKNTLQNSFRISLPLASVDIVRYFIFLLLLLSLVVRRTHTIFFNVVHKKRSHWCCEWTCFASDGVFSLRIRSVVNAHYLNVVKYNDQYWDIWLIVYEALSPFPLLLSAKVTEMPFSLAFRINAFFRSR